MRKVKVLLVNKLYLPVKGGVENHVRDVAEGIKENFSTSFFVVTQKEEQRLRKKMV